MSGADIDWIVTHQDPDGVEYETILWAHSMSDARTRILSRESDHTIISIEMARASDVNRVAS